ncbi:alpha/beta fold hydrolase [Pseudogracilibacillus auburnensis]|uniref:alpha/beta fold hydrolase n=1 Tax=Pseudogracilibacillus auburnensis TaxID=1494959 RepID=UPI001A96C7D2|nr:alpha/beta fold hydrolase [Pseudogracilibacillus auburnensis]MBO1005330.1 alpha/beta fold hydrolase [Pseudogracilibacillus auburnensis]
MNKKLLKYRLFVIFILIIGMVFFRNKFLDDKKSAAEQPNITPTVFIHGYKGSDRSFSTMLSRMEKNKWGHRSIICHIDRNGNIKFNGKLKRNVSQPFIQVIFEDNRARLSDQTIWLQTLMKQLKENYHIENINLVGHSMGGLAATNYLETVGDNELYPRVNKLVTIGSPFLGIDKEEYFLQNHGEALIDLKPRSVGLDQLVKNKAFIPKNVKVLSIAGVISDPETGDGLVSLQSALGNRYIFHESHFEQVILTDPAATHSGLHEHPGVDEYIARFLWRK